MLGFAAAGTFAWALWDFQRWISLGLGGLPANARGWLAMTSYRLKAKNELDVGPLMQAITAGDRPLSTRVRPRQGKRPKISPYPVPHRQLSQLPGEAIREELVRLFDRAVLHHAGDVHYALSHFEKRHPAVTLRGQPTREIAHIHPSDSSMHMILSPADAVAAIRSGWGQRHGLAGIALGLPLTYVMIYAPRNDDELTVVSGLLEAAIAYARQGSQGLLADQIGSASQP